jgi:hypothetical protein
VEKSRGAWISRATANCLRPGGSAWFWRGRRKIAGRDGVAKTGGLVRAIAKRLVVGMAAAAQGDRGASSQAEGAAGGVDDLEVAFHANRAVGVDSDFCRGQLSPQSKAH